MGSGHGHGHTHSHAHGLGLEQGKSKGSISSKLGRLNAAHASATARENAAPHSAVGRIATYEEAVFARQDRQDELQELLDDPQATEEELDAARAAVEDAAQLEVETLSAAANKNVDVEVAQAVNELLGIDPADAGPGFTAVTAEK